MREFASRWETPVARTAALTLTLGLVGCGHAQDIEPSFTTSIDVPTATTGTPTTADHTTPTRSEPTERPPLTLPPPPPPAPTEIVTVTVTGTREPTPTTTPAPTVEPTTATPAKPTDAPKPTPAPRPTLTPTPSITKEPTPRESIPEPPSTDIETDPQPSNGSAIDCLVDKCIALTFDDGPGKYTDQLLGYLDQYDAQATFFLVGDQVDKYPSVAKRIVQSGNQVGNHSTHHDHLTEMTLRQADEDIRTTQNKIEAASGVRPHILRPPGGQTNQELVDYIDLPQILWSVDTLDWKFKDTNYVEDYVLQHASRGDIVLMHDIHPTTVNAMPTVLKGLANKGYKLVTIDQLLGENLPTDRYRQQDMSKIIK